MAFSTCKYKYNTIAVVSCVLPHADSMNGATGKLLLWANMATWPHGSMYQGLVGSLLAVSNLAAGRF